MYQYFVFDDDNVLDKMAKKKAGDRSGLVAEMLQHGPQQLQSVIAIFFTKLIRCEWEIPSKWKVSFVTVLFKKGDPKLPANNRPNTTLSPILYKLFSRVLHLRISASLRESQPIDQAGFRSGYSCEDHLLTITTYVN